MNRWIDATANKRPKRMQKPRCKHCLVADTLTWGLGLVIKRPWELACPKTISVIFIMFWYVFHGSHRSFYFAFPSTSKSKNQSSKGKSFHDVTPRRADVPPSCNAPWSKALGQASKFRWRASARHSDKLCAWPRLIRLIGIWLSPDTSKNTTRQKSKRKKAGGDVSSTNKLKIVWKKCPSQAHISPLTDESLTKKNKKNFAFRIGQRRLHHRVAIPPEVLGRHVLIHNDMLPRHFPHLSSMLDPEARLESN